MPLEIIAELHPQHGGDRGTMREMIRQAKLNGASVAKFQLYDSVAYLGSPDWKYLEVTEADVAQLFAWCEQEEIEFMASVFDQERLRWCEHIGVRRHKIASRVIKMYPTLCEEILATGKETLVSLGAWEQTEKPFGPSPQIKYLYCKAKYPALLEDMGDFPDDFAQAGFAGYSDHTLGIGVCLLAIARGATLVEKHMTLDKTQGTTTEKAHICSMTPGELNELHRIGGSLQRAQKTIRMIRSTQ